MKFHGLLLAAAFVSACSPASSGSASSVSSNASTQPASATSPAPKVVYTGGGVQKLKQFEGKRVREIELWEEADMKARLGKLLGDKFTTFTENWLIEAPIVVDGDILMAAGCSGQDCPGDQYVLFIDLARDNINIQHFEKGKLIMYKEKDEIKVPEKFAADLATMKSNSAIN